VAGLEDDADRRSWAAMTTSSVSVAIVGAGVAGLACARGLAEAGHAVMLFDKGRGPGGRLSTRRVETPLGEARFDHGAQFITARDAGFAACLTQLEAGGFAARWRPRWAPGCAPADDGGSGAGARERWTGSGGMNGIVKGLAAGLDVRWGVRVASLRRSPDGHIELTGEDGAVLARVERAVVATPAEQAGALLAPLAPGLAALAQRARSAPCWAVMAVFESPVPVDWDLWRAREGALGLAARELSRPGRTGPERWMLQGTPDWSMAHLEAAPEAVADALLRDFTGLAGTGLTGAPAPVFLAAHRWRYAQVVAAVPDGPGYDPAARIGTCGDWRGGPRVEEAWLSGQRLGACMALSAPNSP
jgi:renalase